MKITKSLFWIFVLSASIYGTQGIEGLPGMSLFFFLKEHLHFTPEKIMYLGSITGLAWLIKPLWGFLIDNYLTKKVWMLISLIGSIVISCYFGVSSFLPLALLIGLLMLSGWNGAIRDVGVDGIMCVEGKETDTCDKIQSIQWISITVAGIISSLVGGYIADHYSYKLAFLWLIPVYLLVIFIVLRYKTTVQKSSTNDCVNCKFCLECTETLRPCGAFQPRKVANIFDTICSYKELFMDKKFLLVCLFIFLYNYSPSFGTPLMFIQRDHWKWSGTWMGVLGAISSIFEILGALIFYRICKKIDYKKWLKISVLIGACTTLCYLYYTPVTCVIYDILFAISGMFVLLMLLSLMAKSTLTGKEATSFALLCSINNLAGTCSTLSGAYLYPKLGLTWLILLSAGTSFICLPIIKRLEIKNEDK